LKPTTFVLGAGVSMPFGFPSGFGLLKQVIELEHAAAHNELEWVFELFESTIPDFARIDLFNFLRDLKRGNLDSIDRFVQDNSRYGKIAAACIALVMLRHEVGMANNSINPFHKNIQSNVYRSIWNRMAESGDTLNELKKHNFITFNYDRVLEFFIFNSLTHNLNFNTNDATKFVKNMKICHVYGKLGEFESEFKFVGHEPYIEPERNVKLFSKALASLQLLTTTRAENQNSNTVTSYFKETARVVVLGFGYDKTNCDYLRDCYFASLKGGNNSDLVSINMTNAWYGCMFRKAGNTKQKAVRLLMLEDDVTSLHIGQQGHDDAKFFENNILD